MKRMVFCMGMAVACVAATPAFAQQENPSATPVPRSMKHDPAAKSGYREPLVADVAHAGERPRTPPPSPVPVFPSGPTSGERASAAALGFAAKSAFSLAANRTGTAQPVPAPSYAPYRPGMPMPEPGAEAISCEPSGALTAPMACAGH